MRAACNKQSTVADQDCACMDCMEILHALNQSRVENVEGFAKQALRLIRRSDQGIVDKKLRAALGLHQEKMNVGGS